MEFSLNHIFKENKIPMNILTISTCCAPTGIHWAQLAMEGDKYSVNTLHVSIFTWFRAYHSLWIIIHAIGPIKVTSSDRLSWRWSWSPLLYIPRWAPSLSRHMNNVFARCWTPKLTKPKLSRIDAQTSTHPHDQSWRWWRNIRFLHLVDEKILSTPVCWMSDVGIWILLLSIRRQIGILRISYGNVRKGLFINVLMAASSSVLAMAIVGYDDGE